MEKKKNGIVIALIVVIVLLLSYIGYISFFKVTSTLNAEFWNRQYEDHNYKNVDGESLNDTKERMTSAINEIISAMQDGNTVAIISHAAAICAFLLNWCTIEVMDVQKKLRKITYQGDVVMNGIIATPSAFVLEFENEQLCRIKYIDKQASCNN